MPGVHWTHTKEGVLTLDRVHGITVDDLAAIDAAGIDRVALAEKGIRMFYTQVFRDNFFHADAHPGNIWVDTARKQNPRFIALDFGIMGSLSERDQFLLAQNFMALFDRDYKRIAELHLEAGWMPSHIRVDELEAAVRTVCEPYFTRPLSEISLAEVVMKLFSVARQYELTLQPQLILLQKTLLNIEGIGRLLYPQIDIWATAQPVLADILRKRYGLRRTLHDIRSRLPQWISPRAGNAGAGAHVSEESAGRRFRCVAHRAVARRDRSAAPFAFAHRHHRRHRRRIHRRRCVALHAGAARRWLSHRVGDDRRDRASRRVAPHALNVDVVFEDDDLLAVNKPAGLLVHRSKIAADEDDFLLDRLRTPERPELFLIHRLDRATSGSCCWRNRATSPAISASSSWIAA